MKYGVIVCKETNNIGDDIQSYAAACQLPEVNYFIEREHMDIFRPAEEEPVNTIMNGWLMNNKLGWPISPCINPLYISMHFYEEDAMLVADDFLKGIGAEDLLAHAPVGARDTSTMQLLQKNGIPCYFSGCMTLTLPKKFPRTEGEPYVCLTDVPDAVTEHVKQAYPDLEVWVIAHEPSVDRSASWEDRFRKVEELLTVYQNAAAVVTTRLHCAMPCLALETPVLLLDDKSFIEPERMNGLSDLVHTATTKDFLSGGAGFDLNEPPQNPDTYRGIREELIQKVQKFVQENQKCTEKLKQRFRSYDDEWERRALWKNEVLLKLFQKHVDRWNETHESFEAMEAGRQWLMEQNRGLEQQNTALTQQVSELTDWIRQLEQQCAELKGWSDQLTEGTQWLERQNTGLTQQNGQLQEENQELEQQNIELKSWADQLTEAKLWLEGQWKAEKQAHAQTQDALVHAHEQLKDQENAIARQRNMLNLLLNDKWIQKIIRMRKIPVQE